MNVTGVQVRQLGIGLKIYVHNISQSLQKIVCVCVEQIGVYAIQMLVICRVKKTKSRTVWSGTCHGLRGARSSSVWREMNKWAEELKHTKT